MKFLLILLAVAAPVFAAAQSVAYNVTPAFEAFSRHPDVAYDKRNKRFFIVFETDDGDIIGRWVKANGELGPLKEVFKAPASGASYSISYKLPAIVFQQKGAPNGDDALFVTARMDQRFITGSGVLAGAEVVGVRLDLDGAAQIAPIGLSNTSPIGPTPTPITDMDGGPDIAAAPVSDAGPPFVVWTQGPAVFGRWWPEVINSNPFQLTSPGPLTVYDNPATVFQPETDVTPARYVTAFGEKLPRRQEGVSVVAHEVGSTRTARSVQVATAPRAFQPRGGTPSTRQDVSIGYGGETMYVVYNDGLRYHAKGSVINPANFASGRERILPSFYLFARSVQFPVVTGYRGGFVHAYDAALFGGYSVGYARIDAGGQAISRHTAPRPNASAALREGVEHLAIAAGDEDGLIGIAWNSYVFTGANRGEADIWLFVDKGAP